MSLARTVSNDSEPLILVDEDDRPLGSLDKAGCHQGDGMLHRAFSVLVFNDRGELLLQQRSADKALWPGYWSNSCCSHPRVGETLERAVERRLEEELGVRCSTRFLYRFRYHARYGGVGSEREVCSVFVGRHRGSVQVNPTEVAAWRWISPDALDAELEAHPERFTPWFKLEWAEICTRHPDTIDRRSR